MAASTTGAQTPSAPAYQVVGAYLREQAEVLARLDPMVRRAEPDALHQMRIAVRRFRSTLRAFGKVSCSADTDQLAAELKWLGSVLGAERDVEVQAGRMNEHVRQTDAKQLLGPVQACLDDHFARSAEQAHADVIAALTSGRYHALLDAVDAAIADPPLGPDAKPRADRILPAAVRHSYRRTRRRFRQARHAQPGEDRDVALHQARKAAKQTRYAAEAAAPAVGVDASQFARRLKKVQDALGEHQDTVVGRELARKLALEAHQAGESTFTYVLFHAREASEAERLQTRAWRAWHKCTRRRYREWMDVGRAHHAHR